MYNRKKIYYTLAVATIIAGLVWAGLFMNQSGIQTLDSLIILFLFFSTLIFLVLGLIYNSRFKKVGEIIGAGILVIFAGFLAYAYYKDGRSFEIVVNDAIVTKNPSLCNKLNPDSKEGGKMLLLISCYNKVAVSLQDISVCDMRFSDPAFRGMCYVEVNYIKKDINICEEINDQEWRDQCYLDLGDNTTEPLICNKIQDRQKKDYCYRDTGIKTQDLSVCNKILSIRNKDECYAGIARAQGDLSACANLSGSEKNICYSGVAGAKKDLSICDTYIVDKRSLNYCYEQVAIESNNYNICSKIGDSEDKSACYRMVGEKILDTAVCKLADGLYQDICITSIAIKRHDRSICDNISNLASRDNCVAKVKQTIQ